MEELLQNFLENAPTLVILIIIVITLATLSKGADILVDEAVSLSVHWRVPKMIIGTTIVSIGTTLPEAAVSVMAALRGNPDLALGNAVGSIIADTGLIIGVAALLGHLYIDRKTITRQGTIKVAAGILLVISCIPFFTKAKGGNVSQFMGIVFLAFLVVYLITSIRWSRQALIDTDEIKEERSPVIYQLIKLSIGAAIIILSSRVLIPSVEITALRIGIPQSVIAATLVALGTSLPELVTAVTAVRKGHGELAIGNIIGADILNVLFVVGASAAVTRGGLNVPPDFFKLHFPVMIILLLLFRYFTTKKYKEINKMSGMILLAIYIAYVFVSYLI